MAVMNFVTCALFSCSKCAHRWARCGWVSWYQRNYHS